MHPAALILADAVLVLLVTQFLFYRELGLSGNFLDYISGLTRTEHSWHAILSGFTRSPSATAAAAAGGAVCILVLRRILSALRMRMLARMAVRYSEQYNKAMGYGPGEREELTLGPGGSLVINDARKTIKGPASGEALTQDEADRAFAHKGGKDRKAGPVRKPIWYRGRHPYETRYKGKKSTKEYDRWYEYMHHEDNGFGYLALFGNADKTTVQRNRAEYAYLRLIQFRYEHGLCPWQQLVRGRDISEENLMGEAVNSCGCSVEEGRWSYVPGSGKATVVSDEDARRIGERPEFRNALLGKYAEPFRYPSYPPFRKSADEKGMGMDYLEYLYWREDALSRFAAKREDMLDMLRDPYRVLGIGRDAGREEAGRACRAMCRKYDPEKGEGDPGARSTAYYTVLDAYEQVTKNMP